MAANQEKIAQLDDPGTGSPLKGAEKQRRVLLVEDDKALRRFLEISLQRSGYEVVLAADGLEAMKLVLASTVDIVVTDAMMPNLSGYELCRFLRNSPTLAHLPIVLLSGSQPRQGSAEKELADEFLTKPVAQDDLKSCLDRLLARG